MRIKAGAPYVVEVRFLGPAPTGPITWSLFGNDGLAVTGYDNVTTTIPSGAVSVALSIAGNANGVAAPLFEGRRVLWSYPTIEGLVFGEEVYQIERVIPFPVSIDGVRKKLGVEPHELPDCDLLLAYAEFRSRVGEFELSQFEALGSLETLRIVHAIEALGALNELPSLRLKLAQSDSSGTNQWRRFANVDWGDIEARLLQTVQTGLETVAPSLAAPSFDLFAKVARADPVTGV